MKKVFFIVCIVALATNVFAQRNMKGEKGISSAGFNIGYAIESENAVVGIDYRYNILDRVRLAPSLLYVVKKDRADTWYLNADAHYLARISETITLYPIGGLNVSVWNYKIPSWTADDPLLLAKWDTESKTRVGLNLGFGVEKRITNDLIAGVEFRYNWTERYFNQAMVLTRIAYYF